MEFQRIGKNTVQCHMSVEEMQEYGMVFYAAYENAGRVFSNHIFRS